MNDKCTCDVGSVPAIIDWNCPQHGVWRAGYVIGASSETADHPGPAAIDSPDEPEPPK